LRVKKSLVGVFGVFGLFGLASVLASNGCGSSGDGSGTYASALTSCSTYCDAYIAAACAPAAYPTDGQCKVSLCTPIPTMASAGCYSATKSWYDCRRAQADICGDTGCTNQAAAAVDVCR
jgi:hypothetical protein